jgi:signal transduction histidine kinase
MDRSVRAPNVAGRRGPIKTRLGSGGLAGRLAAAAALLVFLIGASFAGLLAAIVQLRAADDGVTRSVVDLRAADQLEKLLVDMETGLRGFVITGEERFLEPWTEGRAAFPGEARSAASADSDNPVQAARLQAITAAATSYIEDYGVPLIEAKRRGDSSASSVETTQLGKDRVDGLRGLFSEYADAERSIYLTLQDAADSATNVATAAAAVGLGASVLLIVLFVVYLARTVVRPVTRAAAMATQLADGDLSTRMPETGTAEIGTLERSFNSLAASLEASQAGQQRLLDQQSALRRVATLVAEGSPPEDVFRAVVREVGEHLPADLADLSRYEPDETISTISVWAGGGVEVDLPDRISIEGDNVVSRVWTSKTTARWDSSDAGSGPVVNWSRLLGLRSSVGCPVVVAGQVWGQLTASTRREQALPADAISWLTAFTDLVGTAISNAAARTELTASRARVVAAFDDARRRIERNLHDGAQQRLVALGLWLRSVESAIPPENEKAQASMERVTAELNGVIDDLREMSRGIYPAILSRGGLNSALKVVAKRSAVPVDLDLRTDATYSEPIQVAAYFVVAEALTNAAKHAAASKVQVRIEERDSVLRVVVQDDGTGGADPARGSGLTGLRDRVEALGGRLDIASPTGGGTQLVVELPVTASRDGSTPMGDVQSEPVAAGGGPGGMTGGPGGVTAGS